MQRSASLGRVTRTHATQGGALPHAAPGRLCGALALAAIYAAAVYASRGLFDTPPTDPYRGVYRLLGVINVALLPLLMLVAVAGIRRLWREGTPNPRVCRLVMAPLWASFITSLLTVPLWMAMANVERRADASGYSATFLLSPWGFMLAYGLALLAACVMYDFTFPIVRQVNTVDIGS